MHTQDQSLDPRQKSSFRKNCIFESERSPSFAVCRLTCSVSGRLNSLSSNQSKAAPGNGCTAARMLKPPFASSNFSMMKASPLPEPGSSCGRTSRWKRTRRRFPFPPTPLLTSGDSATGCRRSSECFRRGTDIETLLPKRSDSRSQISFLKQPNSGNAPSPSLDALNSILQCDAAQGKDWDLVPTNRTQFLQPSGMRSEIVFFFENGTKHHEISASLFCGRDFILGVARNTNYWRAGSAGLPPDCADVFWSYVIRSQMNAIRPDCERNISSRVNQQARPSAVTAD